MVEFGGAVKAVGCCWAGERSLGVLCLPHHLRRSTARRIGRRTNSHEEARDIIRAYNGHPQLLKFNVRWLSTFFSLAFF